MLLANLTCQPLPTTVETILGRVGFGRGGSGLTTITPHHTNTHKCKTTGCSRSFFHFLIIISYPSLDYPSTAATIISKTSPDYPSSLSFFHSLDLSIFLNSKIRVFLQFRGFVNFVFVDEFLQVSLSLLFGWRGFWVLGMLCFVCNCLYYYCCCLLYSV